MLVVSVQSCAHTLKVKKIEELKIVNKLLRVSAALPFNNIYLSQSCVKKCFVYIRNWEIRLTSMTVCIMQEKEHIYSRGASESITEVEIEELCFTLVHPVHLET